MCVCWKGSFECSFVVDIARSRLLVLLRAEKRTVFHVKNAKIFSLFSVLRATRLHRKIFAAAENMEFIIYFTFFFVPPFRIAQSIARVHGVWLAAYMLHNVHNGDHHFCT